LSQLLPPNTRALVVVDNCTAHPHSLVGSYKNFDLKFFPTNITSRAQPRDMGITHSLKSHYKNELSTKKIFAIENKTQFMFNLLECLHLLKESWQKVTEKTVVNCFLKANFMYDENCDLEVCFDNDNELEESFEDDEIETVESVDFQLIDSP
jgi:hypothetical protein